MPDAGLLHGESQFLHEDIDHGPLERCRNVLFVMVDEVRIVGNPFPHVIEERCLQSGERVVKSWYMGLGERECSRIALTCEAVNDGAAGIS